MPKIKVLQVYLEEKHLDEERGDSNLSIEGWREYYKKKFEEHNLSEDINEFDKLLNGFSNLIKYDSEEEEENSLDYLFFESLTINKELDILGISWKFIASYDSPTLRKKLEEKKQPFTILSVINKKDNLITQNIIYGHDGKCIVSVDFDTLPSGVHWHVLKSPGSLKRQEDAKHRYPYQTCPWLWLTIPAHKDGEEIELQPRGFKRDEYQHMEIEFKGNNKFIKFKEKAEKKEKRKNLCLHLAILLSLYIVGAMTCLAAVTSKFEKKEKKKNNQEKSVGNSPSPTPLTLSPISTATPSSSILPSGAHIVQSSLETDIPGVSSNKNKKKPKARRKKKK